MRLLKKKSIGLILFFVLIFAGLIYVNNWINAEFEDFSEEFIALQKSKMPQPSQPDSVRAQRPVIIPTNDPLAPRKSLSLREKSPQDPVATIPDTPPKKQYESSTTNKIFLQ